MSEATGPNSENKNPEDIVSSVFERPKAEGGAELSSIFKGETVKPKEAVPSVEKGLEEGKATPLEAQDLKSKGILEALFFWENQNKSSVGIEIASHSIRVAQLHRDQMAWKVEKLVEKDLPAEITNSDSFKAKDLAPFLKEFVKENQIKGRVYASLANQSIKIKNITLPPMPHREIPEAIRLNTKEKLKDEFDKTAFDYIIYDKGLNEDKDNIPILLVTAPREKILEHIELLRSCGLKALSIEPDILALVANLDFNDSLKDEETVLLFDCSRYGSSLSILYDKGLKYTRALKFSGHEIKSIVKEYCKVLDEEAENMLRHFRLPQAPNPAALTETQDTAAPPPTDRNVLIYNAASFLLEKLAVDIERTFKYFSYVVTKSNITGINRVILTGDSVGNVLVKEFIQNRLHVSVEIDNPFKRHVMDEHAGIDKTIIDQNALPFGVALGLALRAQSQ